MRRARQRERSRRQTLIDLFDGKVSSTDASLSESVRRVGEALRLCGKTRARRGLRALVLHVEAYADRLLEAPRPAGQNDYVLALLRLARHYDSWLRPVDAWRPTSHNPSRQFGQLARHLLARYPVPAFMDSVFFTPATAGTEGWFRHLGTGNNLRTAPGMTVPLTKKMAHHALEAPEHFDVLQAVRWGEVLGLGGTRRLAAAVAATNLGRQMWGPGDEAWWLTILHWFVNHPELDLAQVGPIIDFAHYRRSEAEEPPGHFDIKGRSPAALLRLVDQWHDLLHNRWRREYAEFPPSGLVPGRWIRGRDALLQTWWTEEIRNSRALLEEGRAMRHCVATYQALIEGGHCSIWSLKVDRFGTAERAVTIEVRNYSHRIVQVRGKCNRWPTEEERAVLELWAQKNGLNIVL
jgi:hypothetical protein